MRQTDASLRGLMEAEDYPGAIGLCLECQEATRCHAQFRCIAELGAKLQDTLVLIEEGLDVALSRVPARFDAQLFAKWQKSYALLGKTETSVDQLLMHFASHIHNASFNIVLGTVELAHSGSSLNASLNASTHASYTTATSFTTSATATSFTTSATDDSSLNPFFHAASSQSSTSQVSSSSSSSAAHQAGAFHKKPFSDLCRFVPPEAFIPCLVDLCKAFFGILRNYDQVVKWFRARMREGEGVAEEEEEEEDAFGTPPPPQQQQQQQQQQQPSRWSKGEEMGGDHFTHSFAYVKQKLEHGSARIWQDVQQKIKIFLLASDLSAYQFDEFMQVLRIGNMLIAVGSQFCPGTRSEGLKEGLKKQSTNYFKRYHKACLDELRMFLENESWILLPVKSSFALDQLHEFRFLRPGASASRGRSRSTTSSHHSRDSGSGSAASSSAASSARTAAALYQVSRRVFETGREGESPFDLLGKDEDFVEDVWEEEEEAGRGGGDSDSEGEESKREEEELVVPAFGRSHSGKKGKINAHQPLVTNATLNVLRLFGKYIQMMQALEPIASHVVACMTQLYDFLFYSTFLFFGCSQSALLGGNRDPHSLTGSAVGDKVKGKRETSTHTYTRTITSYPYMLEIMKS